jgi:hypothetical protein
VGWLAGKNGKMLPFMSRGRAYRYAAARLLVFMCASLLLSACGGLGAAQPQSITPDRTSPASTSAPPSWTPNQSVGCAQRVLIISLDGLRPDALSSLRTPNMMRLTAHGVSSFSAQTTMPSTLPAHASMLSGYDTLGHGVFWNDYVPLFGFIRSHTVFSIAHEHGLHTSMLVAKEKLIHIATPGTVDEFAYISGGDDAIVDAGIERIEAGFGVLFIHLRGPDSTGHRYGWMSTEYLVAVNTSDQHVGELLEALENVGQDETTLVIITADHGGSGTSHGSRSEEDMTIPWIMVGPGVMAGFELGEGVRVFDTAATALWALGLALPDNLDGRPIVEAFLPDMYEACGLESIMMDNPAGSN